MAKKIKPTKETESLRIYENISEEDRKQFEDDKNGFEIEYDGEKLRLIGFTQGLDSNGKVVFAYKLKIEAGHVLYYVSKETSLEDRALYLRTLNEALSELPIELEMIDVMSYMASVKAETSLGQSNQSNQKQSNKNQEKKHG